MECAICFERVLCSATTACCSQAGCVTCVEATFDKTGLCPFCHTPGSSSESLLIMDIPAPAPVPASPSTSSSSSSSSATDRARNSEPSESKATEEWSEATALDVLDDPEVERRYTAAERTWATVELRQRGTRRSVIDRIRVCLQSRVARLAVHACEVLDGWPWQRVDLVDAHGRRMDPTHTLDGYALSLVLCTLHDSVVTIGRAAKADELKLETLTIQVKLLNSEVIPGVRVDPDEGVRPLREWLAEIHGLCVDQLRLIHKGQPLLDERTWRQQKATSSSLIHAVITMRGS